MNEQNTTESFTTSSGLEINVNIDSSGEPTDISWVPDDKRLVNTLSENEVLEIAEWLEDYGSDDENDDDEQNESNDEPAETSDLT